MSQTSNIPMRSMRRSRTSGRRLTHPTSQHVAETESCGGAGERDVAEGVVSHCEPVRPSPKEQWYVTSEEKSARMRRAEPGRGWPENLHRPPTGPATLGCHALTGGGNDASPRTELSYGYAPPDRWNSPSSRRCGGDGGREPRFQPGRRYDEALARQRMIPPALGGRSKKDQLGSAAESWSWSVSLSAADGGAASAGDIKRAGMFCIEDDPPSRSTSPFEDDGGASDCKGSERDVIKLATERALAIARRGTAYDPAAADPGCQAAVDPVDPVDLVDPVDGTRSGLPPEHMGTGAEIGTETGPETRTVKDGAERAGPKRPAPWPDRHRPPVQNKTQPPWQR